MRGLVDGRGKEKTSQLWGRRTRNDVSEIGGPRHSSSGPDSPETWQTVRPLPAASSERPLQLSPISCLRVLLSPSQGSARAVPAPSGLWLYLECRGPLDARQRLAACRLVLHCCLAPHSTWAAPPALRMQIEFMLALTLCVCTHAHTAHTARTICAPAPPARLSHAGVIFPARLFYSIACLRDGHCAALPAPIALPLLLMQISV
jgi:hypothetical protein